MLNLAAPPNFRGFDPAGPVEVYYRHLPHWRQEGATYFVTFRLEDALPQEKLQLLKRMRREWEASHPHPRSQRDWEAYARQVTRDAERWMDEGYGACCLATPRNAETVEESLLCFQDRRYFLSCYVVMPNHCHLLMRPYDGHTLEAILQRSKGYTARKINAATGRSGVLWQEESYDRIVRDEEHLDRCVQYIGRNPAQAKIPREKWVRWIHPAWRAAGWDFVDAPP